MRVSLKQKNDQDKDAKITVKVQESYARKAFISIPDTINRLDLLKDKTINMKRTTYLN